MTLWADVGGRGCNMRGMTGLILDAERAADLRLLTARYWAMP
jgi:hypothetical protein